MFSQTRFVESVSVNHPPECGGGCEVVTEFSILSNCLSRAYMISMYDKVTDSDLSISFVSGMLSVMACLMT